MVKGKQLQNGISLFLLIFMMMGCTSKGPDHEKPKADSLDQKTSNMVNVLDLECAEIACFIPVDKGIARSMVPNEQSLYIEEGKAQILFLAQNCSVASWDGEDISPLRKAHIWIRITGPDAVTPIPGVDRTIPNFYWWDYMGLTTNRSLITHTQTTAWKTKAVDIIELKLSDSGKISGKLKGKNQVILEWLTNPSESSPPLGINHIVYGKNENGKLKANISGIIRPVSSGGKTKIKINPDSPLSVFGTELNGMSLDFNMTFQAVFATIAE